MLKANELLCAAKGFDGSEVESRRRMTGVWNLQSVPFCDNRGIFEVFWEHSLVAELGIDFTPVSSAVSHNPEKGTLRGMHFQVQPFGQAKLITCVSGCVFDVIVDLRIESPSYLRWVGSTMEAGCGRSIYIPPGCAHGFVTLTDNVAMAYLIQGAYEPNAAGVLRWNDPSVGIDWPITNPILSDRDRFAPDLVL